MKIPVGNFPNPVTEAEGDSIGMPMPSKAPRHSGRSSLKALHRATELSAMENASMKVTIEERGGLTLRERLRERLDRVAGLRCDEHGRPVVAVTINARENGWFDARYTACCDHLLKEASAIVKDRC